jgi:hypothetical protein
MNAPRSKRGCGVSPQTVSGASRSQSKEGRCMIAHANEKAMERAAAHLIVTSLASADAFRRSLKFSSLQHPKG